MYSCFKVTVCVGMLNFLMSVECFMRKWKLVWVFFMTLLYYLLGAKNWDIKRCPSFL